MGMRNWALFPPHSDDVGALCNEIFPSCECGHCTEWMHLYGCPLKQVYSPQHKSKDHCLTVLLLPMFINSQHTQRGISNPLFLLLVMWQEAPRPTQDRKQEKDRSHPGLFMERMKSDKVVVVVVLLVLVVAIEFPPCKKKTWHAWAAFVLVRPNMQARSTFMRCEVSENQRKAR